MLYICIRPSMNHYSHIYSMRIYDAKSISFMAVVFPNNRVIHLNGHFSVLFHIDAQEPILPAEINWSCRPQMSPMLAPWTLLSGLEHQGNISIMFCEMS